MRRSIKFCQTSQQSNNRPLLFATNCNELWQFMIKLTKGRLYFHVEILIALVFFTNLVPIIVVLVSVVVEVCIHMVIISSVFMIIIPVHKIK